MLGLSMDAALPADPTIRAPTADSIPKWHSYRRAKRNIAVLGASPKPDRYSNQAIRLLASCDYRPIPVNAAFEEIEGLTCFANLGAVPEPIDTITLYVGPARSMRLIDEILAAKPRRIIMNPGAENDALAEAARAAKIEVIEDCTLVMLRAGLF